MTKKKFTDFILENKLNEKLDVMKQGRKRDFIAEAVEKEQAQLALDPYNMNYPAFLLCSPEYLSTDQPNNVWMKELKGDDLKVDRQKAMNQWMNLYNFMAAQSLVYLIPPIDGLQDQVYVANLGISLPHLKKKNVIISNYESEPRVGETREGVDFFTNLGYNPVVPPTKFEGEADLKYIKDNVYVGAYGLRTEIATHRWFEKNYDMKVISLKMTDEYLYHLDCLFFPLNLENAMVCTELVDKKTVKEIEKYVNIVDVDADLAYYGITNSCRLGATIMSHSNINDLKKDSEDYAVESRKISTLASICEKNGLEPYFFNISEYTKSGALLSCCVMHLNYDDYKFNNT